MNISLKRFLETGSLGTIELGSSVEHVLAALGTPDSGDVALQDIEAKRHWWYGAVVLGFKTVSPEFEGVDSISWTACDGEPRLPACCEVEDWQITPQMTPQEVKAYLRQEDVKFQYRRSKGYYERKPALAGMSPEMANICQEYGFLTFKKPRSEADIVRTTTFFTFYLPGGVTIAFVDDVLIHISINAFQK